jgi:hypothetical protein
VDETLCGLCVKKQLNISQLRAQNEFLYDGAFTQAIDIEDGLGNIFGGHEAFFG